MKNIFLGLSLIVGLGSFAQARTVTINCVTPDNKERINLTAVIDHENIEVANMEVISTVFYPTTAGNSSGGMQVNAQVSGGQYFYGQNDNYGWYHFGLYIPNELMFTVKNNYPVQIWQGPAGTNGSQNYAVCNSSFED